MVRAACTSAICGAMLLSVVGRAAAVSDHPVVDAVKGRDKAAVRALLTQKADVNAAEADGATALHWAAYWSDVQTAELLIEGGARVDSSNDYGVTPLWLACSNADDAIVRRLLAAGANPNRALTSGETILMRCALTGNVDAVNALLARGANVHAKEPSHGQTPLMWAATRGHAEVVKILVANGANVSARTTVTSRLMDTGRSGNPERLETMEVPDGGFTSLLFAAQQGAIDAARVLLDAGANVNDTAAAGISALVLASHSGHGRFAASLLDRGADPNADGAGYTALHAAILRGDVALVQALLAHGADPNRRLRKGTGVRRYPYEWVIPATFTGASPFWLASRYAEAEIMRALAAGGADTRTPLEDGTTPLMAAAGVGWSPLLSDRRTRTLSADVMAAEAANERRALEAVKVAIEAGGDVNAANAARETALHGAGAKGFASVVQWLAERGGNLSAPNRAGRTPTELLERFRTNRDR